MLAKVTVLRLASQAMFTNHAAMTMVNDENMLALHWLGAGCDYRQIWQDMRSYAAGIAIGANDEVVWACEHASVYTTGYRAVDNRLQAQLPASLVQCDRGGETTYHGPGQLMLYPLLSLQQRRIGIRDYVHRLESSCIALLHGLGVDADRRCGLPGVWTTKGKIAAMGLKVERGVVYHGMALNMRVDTTWFAAINPCGTGLAADQLQYYDIDVADSAVLATQWKNCLLAEL